MAKKNKKLEKKAAEKRVKDEKRLAQKKLKEERNPKVAARKKKEKNASTSSSNFDQGRRPELRTNTELRAGANRIRNLEPIPRAVPMIRTEQPANSREAQKEAQKETKRNRSKQRKK